MLAVQPVKMFLSYAHDDRYWCNKFLTHLRGLEHDGKIEVWYDALIRTGDDWKLEIQVGLEDMEVFVYLISAAFVDSDYCNDEFDLAANRQDSGEEVRLLGVRLRPVREPEKFSRLQWTPTGTPVKSRRDPDQGFVDAVGDIEREVEEILSRRKPKRRLRRKR